MAAAVAQRDRMTGFQAHAGAIKCSIHLQFEQQTRLQANSRAPMCPIATLYKH